MKTCYSLNESNRFARYGYLWLSVEEMMLYSILIWTRILTFHYSHLYIPKTYENRRVSQKCLVFSLCKCTFGKRINVFNEMRMNEKLVISRYLMYMICYLKDWFSVSGWKILIVQIILPEEEHFLLDFEASCPWTTFSKCIPITHRLNKIFYQFACPLCLDISLQFC